ncbi:MAG TPA: hypothetical protein VHI31_01515, partial [Actinomycetota bacterium]|nr:hypothetical protein [Actinomycetota bacterium]
VLLMAAIVFLRGDFPAPPELPPAATSPAGTQLLDGFSVPAGAVQLGPLLVARLEDGSPSEWRAVLVVTGDPLDVWRRYSAQLAGRMPSEGVDPAKLQGCRIDRDDGFGCEIRVDAPDADGRSLVAGAAMLNPPDDVTGRYLMVVEATRYPPGFSDLFTSAPQAWKGGPAPSPQPPREPPSPGEALAPSTTAYEDDDQRYLLVEGSKLMAQYGVGSLTGGFSVLLAVSPGADAEQVGEAYARQAAQYEGETAVERYRFGDAEFISYQPPGGAGGYQASLWVVDRPGSDDYVFYSLLND